MRNEKEKKEVKANPADYDYLSNKDFPLAGWMWEFIRRNALYRNNYSLIKEKNELNFDPVDLFELVPYRYFWDRKYEDELPDQESYLIIESKIINSKSGNDLLFQCFPDPQKRYIDFKEDKPLIRGLLSVRIHDIGRYCDIPKTQRIETNEEFLRHCFMVLTNYLAINDHNDTIYLGISKNAKIEDIKEQINTVLRKYIPKRKIHRNIYTKWKYYLITYDLIEKSEGKISFGDVATWLTEAFPGKTVGYFDDRNCNNFYNNAVRLINGGYKKYLITK